MHKNLTEISSLDPSPRPACEAACALPGLSDVKDGEQLFRILAENVRDIIARNDAQGRYLYISPACRNLYGYEPEELIGKFAFDFIHPEDVAKLVPWARQVTGDQAPVEPVTQEYRRRCKDGKYIWVEATIRIMQIGSAKEFISVVRDISDRKKVQEALESERRQLLSIFDAIDEAVYVSDPETFEILYCNDAFKRNWGEGQGRQCYKVLQDFQQPCENCTNKLILGDYSGRSYIWEVQNRKSLKWYRCIDKAIRWPDGRMVRCEMSFDITARKKLEEDILNYQQQLRSLASELVLTGESERRRIATGLHDHVGQILAISKIRMSSLRQELPPERIAELDAVRDLLEQAIRYTRSLTFELSPPVLYELGLEAALQWLLDRMQKQRAIEVRFEDDGRRKPLADDIRVLLFQAVRELLANIIKHAQARKVRVAVRRLGNQIGILVEDDGIGFNVHQIASPYRPTGFGLFNIRERLDHLGGKVKIDSAPGQGTRIELKAPI